MSDELKPCPLCGSEAKLIPADDDSPAEVYCSCCYSCGCSIIKRDTAGAIAAWNARAAVTDEQFSRAVHDGRVWQAVRECRMSPARGGGWYCSECSVWVAPGPMANATEHLAPRYCPNCGAKVVG